MDEKHKPIFNEFGKKKQKKFFRCLPMNNMTFYYCYFFLHIFILSQSLAEGFLTVQTRAKILTTFTFTSQTMFTFHILLSLSLSTTLRLFEGGLFAVQSVAMSLGSLAYPLVSTIYMGTLNSYPAAIYNVMQAETWQKDIVEILFFKFVQQF